LSKGVNPRKRKDTMAKFVEVTVKEGGGDVQRWYVNVDAIRYVRQGRVETSLVFDSEHRIVIQENAAEFNQRLAA
jgi:hypothetical protein